MKFTVKTMLSKNKIKFLSSLQHKKYRDFNGLFMAEGEKIVRELLIYGNNLLELKELLATEHFISSLPSGVIRSDLKLTITDSAYLSKISSLSAPNSAALVAGIPAHKIDYELIKNSMCLAFDDIRDPGNLGTIIRTCDWFGIRDIFCSKESVDAYNPKTVQSTMGAIARVRVHYLDLKNLLLKLKDIYGICIIGTMLEGEDMRKKVLPDKALFLFGNESRGLSEELRELIDYRIKIPSLGVAPVLTESLNIASSVAIVCWEFKKNPKGITRSENLS